MRTSQSALGALAASALALGAVGLLPGDALAQSRRPQQHAAPAIDADALARKLRSGEPAAVLEALAAGREAGAAAAKVAPEIEALLVDGTTVEIARAAIEALGAIGQASSSAAVRPYLKHRVAGLRREAVKALSQTKGPEAVAAFREALRSGDAAVRGYAATGLGALGATESLPDLFVALDRNVVEAAGAIGAVCDPAGCRELASRLGKIPLDVMVTGIDPILFRRPPLSDDVLLDIVDQMHALATPEVRRYLADVQSRWPPSGSRAVKIAIDNAVATIQAGQP